MKTFEVDCPMYWVIPQKLMPSTNQRKQEHKILILSGRVLSKSMKVALRMGSFECTFSFAILLATSNKLFDGRLFLKTNRYEVNHSMNYVYSNICMCPYAYHFAACVITLLASSNFPTLTNHFGDSGNMQKYARYKRWGIAMPRQKLFQVLKQNENSGISI